MRRPGRGGVFREIARIDDVRLSELFAREVLAILAAKGLLSSERAERLLAWRHSGFNVHSLVRTETEAEAERIGKYMIRPVVSLEQLEFIKPEDRVGYRIGCKDGDQESMDYLEFIARVTSHVPDKGQVMVRYYGLYANAYRGRAKKGGASDIRTIFHKVFPNSWELRTNISSFVVSTCSRGDSGHLQRLQLSFNGPYRLRPLDYVHFGGKDGIS
jgi:Putative transposase.